jgi:hypothetical protein
MMMATRLNVSRVIFGLLTTILVSCASSTPPEKQVADKPVGDTQQHEGVLALLRSLGARDQESVLLKTDQYTLYFDTRKSWSVRIALPSNEEATTSLDPFLGHIPRAAASKPVEDGDGLPDLLAAAALSNHFGSIMKTLIKALPSDHSNLIPAPGETVHGYSVFRWSGKVDSAFKTPAG